MNLQKISYSSFKLYSECPLKWKIINIDKIEEPGSIFLWRGKVLHACIEKLNAEFLMGSAKPLNTILSIFKKNFMKNHAFPIIKQKNMCIEGQDILTQIYFLAEECSLFKNTYTIEKYFKVPLPFDKDIFLSGKVDRIDCINKKIKIVDYKDGKKHPFEHYSDQLKIYQWAVGKLYGREIESTEIHLLKTSEIISHKKFNSHEINKILDDLSIVVTQINNENFEPQKNDYCNFCAFKEDCWI